MSTPQDDYSAIEPIGETITIAGRALTITPLKSGTIPAFARALREVPIARVFKLLERLDEKPAEELAAAVKDDENVAMPELLDLLADHGDAIMNAVAAAAKIELAVVQDTDLAELILLVSSVFKVNADFFSRRFPAILAGVAAAQVSALGLGSTPSKS
jgi:hypothetical protein